MRQLRALPGASAGRYLALAMPAKPSTAADVVYWTARLAELERQLDAAAKLSEVRMIAGELMRTRQALRQAKAKLGSAGQRSKRASFPRNASRSASSAVGRASA